MQKILEKVLCGIFEKKSALHERALFVRRLRDSNPRYLAVRRFSRPVQSTNSAKPPKTLQIYAFPFKVAASNERFPYELCVNLLPPPID